MNSPPSTAPTAIAPSRVLLGMLTPSSNTILEPVTTRLIADIPEASVHFGRFKVTEIALSDQALAQFDASAPLAAAELLSHAKVQSIGWSGTSAGWRGFHTDEFLCRLITERTGVPACTSILALNEILQRSGVRRLERENGQPRHERNGCSGQPCKTEKPSSASAAAATGSG